MFSITNIFINYRTKCIITTPAQKHLRHRTHKDSKRNMPPDTGELQKNTCPIKLASKRI